MYQINWGEPIGRKNEQSIEAVQSASNDIIHDYDNFKYFMYHMMLKTSPLYQ